MGLISYFKNRYYSSKLNKADKLLQEGHSSEAEEIYCNLLDKQPLAASRLAEYYFTLAQKSDVKGLSELFRKVIDLEEKGGDVYDADSYNSVLARLSTYVSNKAETLFNAGSYEDCWTLLTVFNNTKCKKDATLDLCCEAKINLLYNEIRKVKISNSAYKTYIDGFKSEWSHGKSIKRVVKTAEEFCEELAKNNRFYVANDILSIIAGGSIKSDCLNNAVRIVTGNDSEATSEQQKKTVASYGKAIVLRHGIASGEAVSLFERCWNVSKDVSFALDVLNSVDKEETKEAIINCIFNNHQSFLTEKKLLEGFAKCLSQISDAETSLMKLEKLHNLHYSGSDIEKKYVDRLHDWLKKLSNDEQVSRLDHAQKLFPKSEILIGDKLECAKRYESLKENDKAISVADSIFAECIPARIVKAKALCNKADTEKELSQKESFLRKAVEAINNVSNSDAFQITNRVNESLTEIANLYYANKETIRAYTLLSSLGKQGVEKAVLSIVNHRLNEIKAIPVVADRLKAAAAAIDEINSFNLQSIPQHSEYQSIWDERINAEIENCNGKDNKETVEILERLLESIKSIGFEDNAKKQKIKPVIAEIIQRKYLIARELELDKKNNDAAVLYKEINSLEAKRTPTLSALRFALCKLKSQNKSDVLNHKENIYTLLRNASAAFKSEKDDIAYRFALILLKAGEDNEALAVLNEFLPSEAHLKKACEQGAMIKAQAKLEDFNNKLKAVEERTLSSDDTLYFINHMLEYAEIIKPILNIPRNTLAKYRNTLKNYAIFKLFDEDRYGLAFEKMLKEHSDYLEDLTALRNIALVCLNIAECKQITSSNFKEVIAIWLTAIYQELLFVKSLDYTSWDDKFTFSLYDAYGHFDEYTHENLPDNINFYGTDDSSVVQIKEVQRILLDRFEAAISDNQEFHSFYISQKDAMDALIALNLDEKCRLVAPFLAHKDDRIFKEISDALEQDRLHEYDNWEDVLAVGAIYGITASIYSDYKNAKSYYNDCMDALGHLDKAKANTAFVKTRMMVVKKFDKLYSALISRTNSDVSALSFGNKTEFKKYFNFYLIVCDALKDNTLSFVFSNHIMSFVVQSVNAKKMKFSEAADYILSAYLLNPSNAKVKDNLSTLFEMLCDENDSESVSAVNRILSRVRTCDSSFYRTLNDEYEDAKIRIELNSIVDKVNNQSMSPSSALDRIYSMYEAHPNSQRICSNLAQLSVICIHKYIIGGAYGASSVRNTLNKLKINKSAEFKKQSPVFKKAYYEIWNQLPYDTQLLIAGISFDGTSLNDKGLALKYGLKLMKELGDF